jgi:hypothetical protein
LKNPFEKHLPNSERTKKVSDPMPKLKSNFKSDFKRSKPVNFYVDSGRNIVTEFKPVDQTAGA